MIFIYCKKYLLIFKIVKDDILKNIIRTRISFKMLSVSIKLITQLDLINMIRQKIKDIRQRDIW